MVRSCGSRVRSGEDASDRRPAAVLEGKAMLQCLSDIFSGQGLVRVREGIPVTIKRIFCVNEETTGEILRLYVDIAARLGVEAAGMELPVTGDQAEDALTARLCREVKEGFCELRLEEGGVCLCASSGADLKRGAEYLVTCYPWDGRGRTIRQLAEAAGSRCVERIRIACADLQVTELTCRAEGKQISVYPETAGNGQRGKGDDSGTGTECWGCRASYDRAKKHLRQNLDVRVIVETTDAEDLTVLAEPLMTAALRLALENYETVYPYGIPVPGRKYRNVRVRLTEGKASVRAVEDGYLFSGSSAGLTDLTHRWASADQDPFASPLIADLERTLSCRNELGQAAFAVTEAGTAAGGINVVCGTAAVGTEGVGAGCKTAKNGRRVLVTREYAGGLVDREKLELFLNDRIGPTVLKNFNDEKEIMRCTYKRSWEGRDFMELFRTELLPRVQPGDRVTVSGLLSEDADVRRKLEAEIREELAGKGAGTCSAEILRSFKGGYCWIEERVLPELCALAKTCPVTSVKIQFPYLLNERGDDTFEDESTPNYGTHVDDPQKFFDIPTRWLQELFPVDELIAEKLGIARDAVVFLREDDLPCTYRLQALGEAGEILYEDDFDVKYVGKHYIEKYPQIGTTHVTTGWIRGEINGKTVLDSRVVTDTEKVWGILENEVIPRLEGYLTNRYGVAGLAEAQPLFNRLQLNISMSEMDLDLGFRQERISTAEAMQEDLYFYLLDWFKTFGERECGRELDNVGLIMPEPEICKGEDTQFEMILYDDFARGAELRAREGIDRGEGILPIPPLDVKLLPEEIFLEDGGKGGNAALHIALRVSAESEEGGKAGKTGDAGEEAAEAAARGGVLERAAVLAEMIETGVVDLYADSPVFIEVRNGAEKVLIKIPRHEPVPSRLSPEEKERLIANEVVDYRQYLELLQFYDGREGLRIIPVETTYKGRKIFAVECVRRGKGVCCSESKLVCERISSAFTARHHGNESSSLNSTFMLLDRLLTDLSPELDKINAVLVPFINIDGGMLHCGVQRRHPKWLCHPARYNSAGFEFRKDFNNPHSIYGEARMLGKLWDRYLFDVITDNHGFEGHELCQPFSGYISPWYKSFWVPRALYYGYVWFQGHMEHMVRIGSEIRKKVSDGINGDEEIHRLNQEFADRFCKYAEKWFPELFKLERFNDVVFYWIDTDERPREANYGVRNPEITAIDWTTEVADETAVGDYMALNARAHHISDLAVFEVMRECSLIVDRSVSSENGVRTYTRFRRHPLYSEGGVEL